MSLVEHAPAKINLGLHVLRQRSDGYHEVETVLHRIDWADTVTAEPADTLSMTCSDPALPTDDENLCLQAARRLKEAFGVTRGARLHLEKRVPYGAGLGGGSSDAAATLRLLARLWDLEVRAEPLRALAAQIGADVPFFLHDAPAAYATGRGDETTPLSDDGTPYHLPFPILVVVPPLEISTPEAYGHVSPHDRSRPHLPTVVRSNALPRWRSALTNDFEAPMSEVYPAVDTARQWLWAMGAGYVSLSGSGAAVYGVFESTERAEAARAEGEERDERMHLVTGGQEADSAGL